MQWLNNLRRKLRRQENVRDLQEQRRRHRRLLFESLEARQLLATWYTTGQGTLWGWSATSGSRDWEDSETGHRVNVHATVTPTTEGSDVVVDISGSDTDGAASIGVMVWTEDASAVNASDYSSANVSSSTAYTGGVNYDPNGQTDDVYYHVPTINNSVANLTKSLAIHVCLESHPEIELLLEADIHDDEDPNYQLGYEATTQSATEGSNIGLTLSVSEGMSLEYWVEDATAVLGTDYAVDPNNPYITGGTISFGQGGSYQVPFTTFDNSIHDGTRSFYIHVRIVGRPESAVVLTANILDDENDPPTASDESYSTAEDTALTVAASGVLANDSDPDSDPLTAVLATGPAHGGLTLNANGSFTYTPAVNYSGSDSFTYRANDGAASSNIATVALTVTAVNDPPTAVNDSYSTGRNVSLTVALPGVLANDTDVESNALSAVFVGAPIYGGLAFSGNGSFTYTPNTNYTGPDSFTYRATDGNLTGNVAVVTITVVANAAPVAANNSYNTAEDTALTVAAPGVLANDTDANGDPLTPYAASSPTHGSLYLSTSGGFIYTPYANYNGGDSFTYRAYDGQAYSNFATVTLTITPVNDDPVAANNSYVTTVNTQLNITAPGVLSNDTDVDGNALNAVVSASPAHGSLTLNPNGSFTYTPAVNYTGSDSFTYRANDGLADSNVATVTLTVSGVNSAPVANSDSYSTPEDTPLTIAAPGVLANDPDANNDPLTAYFLSYPLYGSLVWPYNGGFTYIPVANYNGPDSFSYRAYDGQTYSNIVVVSLSVAAVNDPPVAADDYYGTYENVPMTVTSPGVLANDTDVEWSPLSPVLVAGPANGSVAWWSLPGGFIYTPNTNFHGSDSFTYRANDGQDSGNIATVWITVSKPDVAISAFFSDGTDLYINYNVAGVLTGPARLAVYASSDGIALDQQLEIGDCETTEGFHQLQIHPTFADLQSDYYLVAVADPDDEVDENQEGNNTAPFLGGTFVVHEAGRTVVQVQGTDQAEETSLTGDSSGPLTVRSRPRDSWVQLPSGSPPSDYPDFTGDDQVSQLDADAVSFNLTPHTPLWQNPANRLDVTNNGNLDGYDLWGIETALYSGGPRLLTDSPPSLNEYVDVNGDNVLSQLDYEILDRWLYIQDHQEDDPSTWPPDPESTDVHPWRNASNPLDTNADGNANDADVAAIIDYLFFQAGPTWQYDPATIDEVHVRTHGGDDNASAQAATTVLPFWLFGGAGSDNLTGASGSDMLDGGAGDDVLDGGDGDDQLSGGEGSDQLLGGAGNDEMNGGADSDYLTGSGGDDVLLGGDGSDNLSGDGGDDELHGGDGDDTLTGGDGSDVLGGGAGDDNLNGGSGDDALYGGLGADQLNGGGGTDQMYQNGNYPNAPPSSITLTLDPPDEASETSGFIITGHVSPARHYVLGGKVTAEYSPGFPVETDENGTFEVSSMFGDDGFSPGNGTAADVENLFMKVWLLDYPTITASGSTTVTINNVAPTLDVEMVNTPAGGRVWEVHATVNEAWVAIPSPDRQRVTIDWGDGSQPTVIEDQAPREEFIRSHEYPDGAADYPITITTVDDDGGTGTWSGTLYVAQPISLVEQYIYGWEAQDLNYLLRATAAQGSVTEYKIDVNRDGVFDYTSEHDPEIRGALEFDLRLLQLLGDPADDGQYPAIVRVVTDQGLNHDFDVNITIGNMPPDIEFGETDQGDPGVPFVLSVSTSDPGPDTVTQIAIDWGDGSSTTISGASGTPSHAYADIGHYIIRATATDEDGSYWAEWEIDVGDDNTPIVDDGSPEIISAIASILGNGNASLVVEAVDSSGSSDGLTYEWDLDGDGVFETPGNSTIELVPGDGVITFSGTVRVTDAVGRSTEGFFQFTDAGNQTPGPTVSTYRDIFIKETPDLPPGWRIHHTLQQMDGDLTERFRKERGINIHELQYLRGVPNSVHKDINAEQIAWWAKMKREHGWTKANIPLDEVLAQAAKMEKEYASRWVKSGAKMGDITKVKNIVKNQATKFALDKAARWKRLGLLAVEALPIFVLLGSNAEAFQQMKNFNPETHPEFNNFMDIYRSALNEAIFNNHVSNRTAHQLVDSMITFGKSMGLDNDTLDKAHLLMGAWIDLNIP